MIRFSLLGKVADNDDRVTVVHLQRNYGKTEALVAGFDHANGDYIIVMDGDLQHNPNEIPLFMQKLEEGFDVVLRMPRGAPRRQPSAESASLRGLVTR